jgi:hypothetical protein
MTWDSQQFAVLGAAAVGAAGATLAGVSVARRQARTAFRLAARASKVTAYEEAIALCGQLRNWSLHTYPTVADIWANEVTRPSYEDQVRANLLVTLHGSLAVRDAFAAFDQTMKCFTKEATELDSYLRSPRTKGQLDVAYWNRLDGHRQAVNTSLLAVESAMRADIADLLD